MKNLLTNSRSILLLTISLAGISSVAQAFTITGLQNYWVKTCNSYPDQSFYCSNNSTLTAHVLTFAVCLLVGYLLFVKWLGIMGYRRLILISTTFLALLVWYTAYTYGHLIDINASGEDYLNSGYIFFLNWSNVLILPLLSSLWMLIPSVTTAKRKPVKKTNRK